MRTDRTYRILLAERIEREALRKIERDKELWTMINNMHWEDRVNGKY